MYINFHVNNQNIKRTDTNEIVADSRNYLYASFQFSHDWQGTKTAIFKNGDIVRHVVLENDECKVPWEVIKYGKLSVSVFCGDLITSGESISYISSSGYTEGEKPEDPTPTLYEQIIKKLDDIETGTINPEDIAKAVEDYLTEHPIETITEDAVEQIVSDYITSHKDEWQTTDQLIPESLTIQKTKTHYTQSEELNIDDLTVTCNYTDGTHRDIETFTTNLDDIDMDYAGTKILRVSYMHNGHTVTENIPITVEFNESCDSVQYAFKVAKVGILKSTNTLASCTHKIIRYSKFRLRLRLNVYIDFNSLNRDCKISCGNDNLWGQEDIFGHIIIPARQSGMFELNIDKEIEFDNTNITVDNGKDLVVLKSDGGMDIQGSYEMKDISVALTEPVEILPYSLQATKKFTYAVLGEEMATDDITVTCFYNTDAKSIVTDYDSNLDEVIHSETCGDKSVSVYYTESNKTVTTTFDVHFFDKKREDLMPFIPMKAYDWYSAWTHGINLGNAFDPYFSVTNPNGIGTNIWSTKGDEMMCNDNERLVQETRWFQPKYTEQDIKNAADAGIQMVRIPVTWSVNGYRTEDGMIHIGKYFSYRIREILDWCHKYGLYVLINTHHDSKILYDLGVSPEKLEQKKELARVMWTEIAELLKDYDQTVAFEGFNEIDNLKNSWMPSAEAQLQMNELNQVFVDSVRATGGNNLKRVLCCPVLIHKGYSITFDNFVVPNDIEEGYIGTAVHWYADNYVQGIDSMLKFYEQKADNLGIPVMVNEFGKTYSYNDRDVLSKYYQNYVARARHFNVAPVAWDNGSNYTLLLKVTDSRDSSGKWHSEMRPSTFANGEYAKKYQQAMIRGSEGYAWSVSDNQYMCFKEEVNDWYLGLINDKGEDYNNSWNGKVSPFIEVREGETFSVVFSRNSSLSMEKKMQIGAHAFYDSDYNLIEVTGAAYGSDTISVIVPDGACFAKIYVYSKHYSVSEEEFSTMFSEDTIEIMHYKETDISEVRLPDRIPVSLDILSIKTEYQIGEEFDPSIEAKVMYNDGQYLSAKRGLTIDSSLINSNAKGKYPITISFESSGTILSEVRTIIYGLWIRSLLLCDEDILSVKLGKINADNILDYLNPRLIYTDDTEVSISTDSLSLDTSRVDFDNEGEYSITAHYTDSVEGDITASILLELYTYIVYKESSVNLDEYNIWLTNYIETFDALGSTAWQNKALDVLKSYKASGDISVVWSGTTVYIIQGKCWYDDTNIYSEYPIVKIANMNKGIMQVVNTSAHGNECIYDKESTNMYYYVKVDDILDCVNDIYFIKDVSEIKDTILTLDSISATKTTTQYTVGDTFDYSDVTVTATYSDGSTRDVTAESSINTDNVNMNESNTFSVSISYTEGGVTKTTSIDIMVTEPTTEPDVPDPEPTDPTEPEVPQVPDESKTWQMKTTTGKKYIILGTDDDNAGNAKYFRLLRTYGFPYTMNVEAENASIAKALGNDVEDTIFTDTDAPALFPDGVDIITLGKYLNDNNLGEVAQHGASSKVLWDSERLTGEFLTSLHASYVEQGGTKTEEELRTAIMEQLGDTDGSQGAVYVDNSRAVLEEKFGFPIYTVGMWGGSPIATIDGIACNLNTIKGTSNYDWRAKKYTAVGSNVGNFTTNMSPYDLSRVACGVDEVSGYIDRIGADKVCEFFWHMPFNDEPDISKWRTLFSYIKGLVNEGKAEVITRKQYAELGEYVANPITSLSLSRNGSLTVGDIDTDEAYTVTVTYSNGTTENLNEEVILDRSLVNTGESGTYTVYAYYRGFTASLNIIITSAGYTLPDELKSTDYWFVYSNNSNGNWYCGNYSKGLSSAYKSDTKVLQFTASESAGKLNGWKSTDNGATWVQVTTNRTVWNTTISTSRSSDTDGGYQFNSAYNDDITWLETSGNFEITY